MLKNLFLAYWKSFEAQPVPIGGLTLFVGPNASGKSNVLDALRFLQGAALDFPLYEVLRGRWEGGRNVWPGIRGGEAEAALTGKDAFGLGTSWTWRTQELTHKLFVDTEKDIEVHGEELATDKQLFSTQALSLGEKKGHQPGGAIRVALLSQGKGKSVSQALRSSKCLLGQLEPGDRTVPETFEAAAFVRSKLREIVFFDLQPSAMRLPSTEGAPTLGTAGENLASILQGMDDRTKNDLVDWLSELCAPTIEGLEFEVSPHSRTVTFMMLEGGGRRISAASLSDGTLRFLGLLTALLTAPPESIVVLEEPDIGLHPSRVHLLAELLERLPASRKIQVIATTHSPGLLSHLSDTALADVIAFDRVAGGNSVCSRVGSLPNFETLRTSKNRDHLISTGWLERAV